MLQQITTDVPYNIKYLSAAAIDVIQSIGNDISRDRETGDITARLCVYNNESEFSVRTTSLDEDSSRLCVRMVSPSASLSENGRHRAVCFISDSILQLLENVFSKKETEDLS